ncbi:UDP-glucose 4-epimerase GalE [Vibrio cincinnatiensis]|jgi:UDP-glucose 4-epimerase|uniref:UDP-glucose 4-epimerase n=1 Tax=Vibrio cincinnatiensis DSM 19608 TaxID=1123491 RepID=A0A1T4KKV2_VIBCI|nr:UDP-glucose 4-epimerase GalE [Vibrio cincinnatiensis]MCG3726048.1 UDP-glucose 4-epimerase GalE [Vibrio cincinnatiensis]MCG3759444.1 UDP-glucose 4-epimerase GalE [Vibrio cincinnatiensis]MCG3762764.1 UDP-glucose 4-epimerase GalE [Vibrio cincinnatiensis]SJZ42993.1 UDP-glucose 4-epimerase [Vibrio cincinnatiensis DSM 19608]SUP48561.1 UDP-glucose 4-epimerase [Vibrio cincinnatiensis]
MKVLVTGGMGYIGSHTCIQMIQAGMTPIIMDNLYNSKSTVLDRIEKVSGVRPTFILGDIRDKTHLVEILTRHQIESVIHFAGLKAVGESVQKPLEYYDTNVNGTLVLVAAMREAGVKSLVFSSSATVYGDPASVPITESFPTSATNPYGRSKLMVEECLTDFQKANPDWSITLLRYFNPVGSHPSGELGEDPQGIPNNLMPFISQVAVGRREYLSVFGSDYPTKDGTGVRDYIHVMDLADGHIAALRNVGRHAGLHIFNLGTGKGYSVLDMVHAFELASQKNVPYQLVERRPGDIAECWADPTKARQELGWQATRTLQEMTEDTWRWQSRNPQGYPDA